LRARYLTIKDYILDQIEIGVWRASDKVSSENELAQKFSVSRMTARKAVDTLCSEGTLVRSQGLGTFVADRRPVSSLLEIHNIADEVVGRGHDYTCRVIKLEEILTDKSAANLLEMSEKQNVYHSILVHLEDNIPVQYEDRLVNPKHAPDYIHQDFLAQTPNAYLSIVAPLTEADHIVEALVPSKTILSELDSDQPCLKITRRTWSRRGIVSIAYLYHPGDRYRLGGHLQF